MSTLKVDFEKNKPVVITHRLYYYLFDTVTIRRPRRRGRGTRRFRQHQSLFYVVCYETEKRRRVFSTAGE